MEYTYKQGDIVEYILSVPEGVFKGTGRIVGVATNPLPEIGAIFMVEDPEKFPNSIYPYTTIPMQEVCLRYLYHVDDEYIVYIIEGDSYGLEVQRYGNNYQAAKSELEFHRLNSPNHTYVTARVLNHSIIKEKVK